MPGLERLTFKTRPEHTTWADMEAMWREAEAVEHFDGGWLYDHFYPIYGDKTGPCFEGWTALSYLAGITKRLRLGLMVTGNPYRLQDARCEPKPLQKPYPPILMGGVGEKRFLKIAARFADDWNYPLGTPEDFAHKLAVLHAHCERVDRDPSAIVPSCHVFVAETPAETAAQASAFVAAGARHICLYFEDNTRPDALGPTAEAVIAAV